MTGTARRPMLAVAMLATTALALGLVGARPASAATVTPTLLRVSSGSARQLIVVRSASWSATTATLEAWERTEAGWVQAMAPVPARLGRRGTSTQHREGDGTTPAGAFTITEAFGLAVDPGAKLPYRQAGRDDWWVSDPAAPTYNTWQSGPPAGRWNPAAGEHLVTKGSAYRYVAVIDDNRSPVVPGAGSAIFLHIGAKATSGCVAVALPAMLRLIRWLDPAKSPAIAIGPEGWLLDAGSVHVPVRSGRAGEDVRAVQRALVQRGVALHVDGRYGARTRRAVQDVQRAAGLAATGTVDAATAAVLGLTVA